MSIQATLQAHSGPWVDSSSTLCCVDMMMDGFATTAMLFLLFNLLPLLFHPTLRGWKQTWNLGNLFRLHTHSLIRSSPRWVSRHPAWAWISTSLDQPDVEKSGKWTPSAWVEFWPGKNPNFIEADGRLALRPETKRVEQKQKLNH